MALHLPQLSHHHMPIVKTAKINQLIAEKTRLLDEAAIIQHEINRLTEIEQRKVLGAYERRWKERGVNSCKRTLAKYTALLDQQHQELAEYYALLDGAEIIKNEGDSNE